MIQGERAAIREPTELGFDTSYVIRRDGTAAPLFSASQHTRLERNHFLDVAAQLRGWTIDQYLSTTHLLASATLFFPHTHTHTQTANSREWLLVCVSRSLWQITSQTCCLTHQRALVTSGSLPLSALTPTLPPFSRFLCGSRALHARFTVALIICVFPDDGVLLPYSGVLSVYCSSLAFWTLLVGRAAIWC